MMTRLLILIAGGALGTLLRYGLTNWAFSIAGASFPYGTAMANMLGCLILGVILGIADNKLADGQGPTAALSMLPTQIRLFVLVGFLGALTTFSSYELEAFLMVKQAELPKALFYLVGSVAAGFAALWFSYAWAKWFFSTPKWN